MFRIALVHPDIPQNTGNIGRLCVGLDVELYIIHPLGFVLDDKQIRRAGLNLTAHSLLFHQIETNRHFGCSLYTQFEIKTVET